MARDLVLDVIARKQSRDLFTLADEFDRLSKRTDESGKKFGEFSSFSNFLEGQLYRTRVQVQQLGQEFERTGDKDVFAKLRGAQANEKSLLRIKNDLEKSLGDGGKDGGKRAGESFGSGFSSTFRPSLITAAIVAGVTLAPGVLLAATGMAGLGLGIVGQLQNPAIHTAAAEVGHDVMTEMGKATASFEGPLISALHTLGDAAKQVFDSIDFGSLSKEIEPLASGIGALITNTLPGFKDALKSAGPIIDSLAADLPVLGDAISGMFEDMSQGGEGAREGLHVLMMTLTGLVEITGKVILGLSNLTAHIVAAGERFTWWASAIAAHVPIVGKLADAQHKLWAEIQGGPEIVTAVRSFQSLGAGARLSAEQLDALSAKINETKTNADTLAGALAGKVFNTMMSVDQATLSWHQSLTQLGQAVTRANHSIDENTEKGQANRQAILGAVTANMAQYQAQIAAGMSAQDAASAYDANTQALERQLRKAGLTQGAIDGLIGKYAAVPDQVNTDIAAHGLTDAINNLGALLAKVNNLDGRDFGFTVTETDIRKRINEDMGHVAHGGNIRGYAGGGRVFEVGEMGRELLTLPAMSAPAYVTPNSTLNGSANGGAGPDLGTITVVVQGDNGEDLIRKIVTVGRRTNRTTFDTLLPVKTSR